MTKFKAWISAARLRTLPLSLSGIITGTAMANFWGYENNILFFLALLTTVGFQITSNFANDYGDGIKGTDNEHRIGPKRAFQSGALSRIELKWGIASSIALSLVLAFVLIYTAFGSQNLLYIALFGFLGVLSVWAAVTYTVGDAAYGYKGLGDVFVFVFFGWVAVLGTLFLYTQNLTFSAVLPATGIGLLSAAVLNLNNLRDHESDKITHKNTLVVKMGYAAATKYHSFLLIGAFVCFLFFVLYSKENYSHLLPLIAFIPIFLHLRRVMYNRNLSALDPELKKLALSTFLLSLLFYISFNNFL
ncbi:1,4-dihydroxy-2-naphthoate octaprenyltransferase [Arenibacter sp. GZD96]|uniref:1,4-dihydroxy-2-naphthoate octaprenyltransferase n=1 Tax=Aurantibrevibacter litoralis TaxID=3106030 RepID=UPI002AFF6806|nr:1,4-dihydroxy-2-naphthoate octaprenyltransferase [Arenibacter sp. GZD-96]MEA1786267.1 1,4-dihydroxy-2-naphthoate octaprenyltransferase [Arenibacter sp. GZD-96]